MILVSIIIPVYNVEKYILRCLESVKNQTYTNYEVIIIDDCGNDNSIEIAKNFIYSLTTERAKWKIIYHKNNCGLSVARNSGIFHSKGQFLYFLDSDDAIVDNAIERLVENISSSDIDLVVGNFKIIGNRNIHTMKYNHKFILEGARIIESYVNNEWSSMACNKLIRKKFLLDNALFFKEGIYHEDELWTFKVALTAHHVIVDPEEIYLYFLRNDSISGCIKEENFISNRIVLEEKFKNYDSCNHLVKIYLIKLLVDFYYSYFRFSGITTNFVISRNLLQNLRMKIKYKYVFELPLSYKIKFLIFISPIKVLQLWKNIISKVRV